MRLWRLAAIGVEDERPSVCSLTPQRNNRIDERAFDRRPA